MCFCAGEMGKYMLNYSKIMFTHTHTHALHLLRSSVTMATPELSLNTSETK